MAMPVAIRPPALRAKMRRTAALQAPRALSNPIVALFSNIIISNADTMATALTRHMMTRIRVMLALSKSSHENSAGCWLTMVCSAKS